MEQIMINNNNTHHKNNMILSRMHKDSQTILSKNKPQVRIIHIFAPEIIKTDPANFMELVQRLTGKPNSSASDRKKKNKSGRKFVRSEGDHVEVVKREEAAGEIWRSSSSSAGSGNHESGGFLDGFGDMDDGFMHQLGPDILLPHNHNPVIMHQYQQQQQQQYHFFGDEDHNSLNRVHGGNLLK